MNSKPSKPSAPKIAPLRPIPSIYVEGITQMSVGFPNSRLLMHSFTEKTAPDEQETRHVVCELIMPTAAIVELAQNLINQIAENKDLIIKKGHEFAAIYDNIFKSVEPINIVKKSVVNAEKKD
jgi:hypothetical protein